MSIEQGLAEALRPVIREEIAALALQEARAPGFLNVEQAAQYLATSPAAIRSMVQRDALPVVRTPNGRLLFDLAALDAWARSA